MSISPRLSIKPLLTAIVLIILFAVFIRVQLNPIAPLGVDANKTIFSAERAYLMLQKLNPQQLPHPLDSESNRLVENRLVEQLKSFGYIPEIQQTQICQDSQFGRAACLQVRNIIVEVEGSSDGPGILLSSHYDSVPAGPGASDAGAAVASMLEIARLLKLQRKPLNPIIFLFNEGEEFGLFGAKAFMQQHPLAKNLQLVINVEARGSSGQSVMFETGEDSGWLVKHYAQSTPAPLSSSLFYEVYKFLPNNTDLTIFKEYGLQGLNFAHAEKEPHYHTPLDNLQNLNKGSLQHHGDNVWGVLKTIKDIDLNQQTKGNLVYTDLLGLVVVDWQETNSLPLTLILLCLFVLACWQVNSHFKLNLRKILKGLVSFFSLLILTGLSGLVIQKLIQFISENEDPWRANNLPMQIAVWSFTSLVSLIFFNWSVKKNDPISLLIALLSGWFLLAIASGILMPGISFLFILPLIMGVLSLLFLPIFIQYFSNKALYIALILVAITAVIIFMPIVYVLEIMLSYSMTVAISLMFGFVLSGLMPLLSINVKPHQSIFVKLVLGLTLTTFVAVFYTCWQAPFSQDMPQELNINYLQDSNNQAFIIVEDDGNDLPKVLRKTLGVIQRSQILPWRYRPSFYAETDSTNIPSAKLTILESELVSTEKSHEQKNNGRKVKIQIASDDQALSDIKLYIAIDAGLISINVGENILDYQGEENFGNGFYEYRCRGISCADINLTLNFDNVGKTKVMLVNVLQGLPESKQYLLSARGELATERQDGDQSIVITEYEL